MSVQDAILEYRRTLNAYKDTIQIFADDICVNSEWNLLKRPRITKSYNICSQGGSTPYIWT